MGENKYHEGVPERVLTVMFMLSFVGHFLVLLVWLLDAAAGANGLVSFAFVRGLFDSLLIFTYYPVFLPCVGVDVLYVMYKKRRKRNAGERKTKLLICAGAAGIAVLSAAACFIVRITELEGSL